MSVRFPVGRVLTVLAIISPAAARALPTVTGVSSAAGQSTYDGSISATDLGEFATVSGTAPSLGSLAGLQDGSGSPVNTDTSATLTNDAYFDGTAGFGTSNLLASHPTVVYSFNTGAGGSSTGYNITNVVSTNGWHDHGSFSDQDYSILYATIANPTAFKPLATVAYNPFDPANDSNTAGGQYNSSQVTVTDSNGVLATGVAALEFIFSPYSNPSGIEQSGQVIREIDVNGIATPVPEPVSIGLIAGGAIIGLSRRRRSTR